MELQRNWHIIKPPDNKKNFNLTITIRIKIPLVVSTKKCEMNEEQEKIPFSSSKTFSLPSLHHYIITTHERFMLSLMKTIIIRRR